MSFINENKEYINYNKLEIVEQNQVKKYINKNDCVLELGGRYGGVSVAINNILCYKANHVVVEPDCLVWDALKHNRDYNDCHFKIIQGTISNKKQQLQSKGFATYTIEGGEIPNYPLPLMDFNVLVADCEGALELFYNENKSLFDRLRLIIFEKDRKKYCNYDYLCKEFIRLGFNPLINDFHSVYIRS